MNNLKYKYLIVGASGTGKSSLVEMYCEKYGTTQLMSYTTRKQRENEKNTPTHIHANKKTAEDIMSKREIVAYTYYNKNMYFATMQQFKNCNFYVIDINGIKFMEEYNIKEKIPYKVIYIYSPLVDRLERLINRGDDSKECIARANDYMSELYMEDVVNVADYLLKNDRDINLVFKELEAIIKESESY